MAETKAEDEDDESFGDFTFASFPNQSLHTKTTTTDDDTDEWGDFVESPLGSELHTAPSPGQISSRNNNNNQWVKPKGALPLSLFGGEEEEESRVVVDASAGDVKVKHPFTDKSNDNKQLKSENGFDDIIANLYGPNKQMKPGNGFSSNSDVVVNVNTNGSLLKSDLAGNGNSDSFANLYDQSLGIKNENGVTTNSSKFGWNSNGSTSDLQGLNSNGSSLNLQGLNASGSSSNLQGLNANGWNSKGSSSNLQSLNANGSSSNLQGLNFNGSNSNLQENANGSSSNLQGLNANGSNSNLQGLNANGWNSKGSSPNLQGLNANGSSLNLQVLNFNGSNSNLQGLNANGSSSNLQGLNANGSNSNLQGLNANGWNSIGLSSNMQGLNASGLSLNLQGWNFNGSSTNLQGLNPNGSSSNLQGLNANGLSSNLQGLNANGSSSNLQGLNGNGLSSNLQGWNSNGPSSNLQDLNSNGSSSNLKGLNLSFNGLNLNSGSNGGNEGFEVACNSESKVGITAENGFSSNSNKLDSVSNASNSNLRGLDWNFNGLNSDSGPIDGKEEIEDEDDDDDDGWEFKVAYSEAKVGDGNITTENSFTSNPNKLDVNSNASSSNLRGSNSNSESVSGNVQFDANEDVGWGFKDAYSESKIINGNDKGPVALELSGVELESTWEIGRDMQVDQKEHELTTYSSGFGNGLGGPIDLFSDSNAVFSKPHEDTGFDFKSSKVAESGSLSDSYFQSDQNDIENRFDSHPPVQHADPNESFGDFKAAFSETESKHDEEPNISNRSTSEVEVLAIDGKNQGNEMRPETHKGPVPLSIFGDEELETNGSSSIQDDFTFKPASFHRNTQSNGSSLSLDNLFELYNQAEPVNSTDSLEKPTQNGLDSTDRVLDSKLMDDGDDFEDSSWEFKDAVSPTIIKDAPQSIATETNLNNYADFYCKLKDELCAVARYHLAGLKQAQSSAALSGEDEKVAALDEEIQEACEELHKENIIYEEPHSEDRQPRDISLKEFLEVLNEPKFQVLESEYHLSSRLSMAEKDFKSAVELIKHATTMLKILTLVSLEEQSTYVSTWSKMLSVCAQELKHGAWIWKQTLEKKVHNRIISEPQGKRFIIALGEIYRVVAILGASVKLYRPWTLSSSVDSTSICALFEECHMLWSSSGLEETLPTISDPVCSEYNGTANALAESIKQIRGLDAFALWNRVFAQQESVCRLSILSPGVVPDIKMVAWDGGNYFLTIANLWANLISCDPPKLPHLQFS